MTEAAAEMILAEVREVRAMLDRLAGERLNVSQAAAVLGVSINTLRKMEADGRVKRRGDDGKWLRADLTGVKQ